MSFESKTKIIKVKEIMKEWKTNQLSTLRYLMFLTLLKVKILLENFISF